MYPLYTDPIMKGDLLSSQKKSGNKGLPLIERRWFPYTILIILLASLYLTSAYNYLLFHSLAEVFGMAISFTIAAVVLSTRRSIENNYLLVLGMSYLFTAVIEMLHMLGYKGMGIFEGGSNLPTQLWLAFRYIQAITLLIAPLTIGRKIPWKLLITSYAAVTSILIITIFLGIFPTAHVDPTGLTPFKVISEYVIIGIATIGGILLFLKRSHFDRYILRLLMIAVAMFILAELMFTLYISVYSSINMLGHIFMLAEFFLVFMAIVHTGVSEPTRLIYRELSKREKMFRGLVENARDILFQYELIPELKLTYISPAVEEFTGYSAEELCNNPAKILPADHPMGEWIREESGNLEDDWTMGTYRFPHKDGGKIWLQAGMVKVYNDEGKASRVIGISRDVTELMKSFEQLQITHDRLQLLGHLTSHDLSNHITVALCYLELAMDSEDESEKNDYLVKGLNSMDDMIALIESTGKYFELGEVPLTWMDLNEAINLGISSLDLHDINIDLDVLDIEIYADGLLLQVFYNLFQNTMIHGTGAKNIRVWTDMKDDKLVLIYEDDGPGVSAKDKDSIFEFVHNSRSGHGLHFVAEALAISGMKIDETGEYGKGIRFEIEVPVDVYRFKDMLDDTINTLDSSLTCTRDSILQAK